MPDAESVIVTLVGGVAPSRPAQSSGRSRTSPVAINAALSLFRGTAARGACPHLRAGTVFAQAVAATASAFGSLAFAVARASRRPARCAPFQPADGGSAIGCRPARSRQDACTWTACAGCCARRGADAPALPHAARAVLKPGFDMPDGVDMHGNVANRPSRAGAAS